MRNTVSPSRPWLLGAADTTPEAMQAPAHPPARGGKHRIQSSPCRLSSRFFSLVSLKPHQRAGAFLFPLGASRLLSPMVTYCMNRKRPDKDAHTFFFNPGKNKKGKKNPGEDVSPGLPARQAQDGALPPAEIRAPRHPPAGTHRRQAALRVRGAGGLASPTPGLGAPRAPALPGAGRTLRPGPGPSHPHQPPEQGAAPTGAATQKSRQHTHDLRRRATPRQRRLTADAAASPLPGAPPTPARAPRPALPTPPMAASDGDGARSYWPTPRRRGAGPRKT